MPLRVADQHVNSRIYDLVRKDKSTFTQALGNLSGLGAGRGAHVQNYFSRLGS